MLWITAEQLNCLTAELLNTRHIFHTFFKTFILVQPKLIGVQFIKMTATFIHKDLQSWRGDAGWPAMIRVLYLVSACLALVAINIIEHWPCPLAWQISRPQSLFFITRCHQICSPIKIFTLITISYQGMPGLAPH